MNFTEGHPTTTRSEGSKRAGMSRSVLIVIIIAISVTLIAIAAAVFFFVKYGDAKNDNSSTAQNIQERISDKVARLYDAPSEDPTIARVSDKETLRQQEGDFFDKAQNGDFVVVYAKAQVAILYRETTDKIINIGPIDLEQTPGIDSSQ
jgi:hypothetical protein